MSDLMQWRSVVGYGGRYEVSDCGVVRSIPRPRATGGVLSVALRDGYPSVHLQNGKNNRKMLLVHRLVLEAFIGPCPAGLEAAHLNGVRTDCRLSNLAWVSRKENHSHKERHGTSQRGERAPSAKLNRTQVEEIRSLYRKEHQTSLAKRFGVSRCAIQRIHEGITWTR